MRKKQVNSGGKSATIAIKFFLIVLVFILISLIFKTFILIGKSRYLNQNQFTISVYGNKYFKILSLSKKSKTISVLKINSANANLNIGRFLGIPIDGKITIAKDIESVNVPNLLGSLALNYPSLKTDLTIIDMVRLYLFARAVSETDINEKTINLAKDSMSVDEIALSFSRDNLIEDENAGIQIVNSANVSGLGYRLGRLITNMGGRVVMVTSGNKEEASTISYFGKKTYTIDRIEKILGYKLQRIEKKGIADIVIVIGKDSISNRVF